MTNVADSKIIAHQPLSYEEVARAVDRLGPHTLDLPRQTAAADAPQRETGELQMMSAKQRFWFAFTGKPGSSGRAGPAYEPGLPRSSTHGEVDAPFGIPRQRRAAD